MLPRVGFVLTDIASPVDQTGEAFLFLLVSLIEKGKKRKKPPKALQLPTV